MIPDMQNTILLLINLGFGEVINYIIDLLFSTYIHAVQALQKISKCFSAFLIKQGKGILFWLSIGNSEEKPT